MKIQSSTLLEMVVALTIMLTILTITFGIFMNVYKSSLTLPTLKNQFTVKKIIAFMIMDKSNIKSEEVINGIIITNVKTDYSLKNLIQLSSSYAQDTNAFANKNIVLFIK